MFLGANPLFEELSEKGLNLRIFIIGAVVLVLFSCAVPKVKQRVLMPANADAMKNTKKIAVIHFHGDRNEMFTRKMRSFFTHIMVENKFYFSVVDHEALNTILKNQFVVPENLLRDAAKLSELSDIKLVLSAIDTITSSINQIIPGLDRIVPDDPGIIQNQKVAPSLAGLPATDTSSYVFRLQDAAQLGSLSDADTIIAGVVKWPRIKNSIYKEDRSRCIKLDDKKTSSTLTSGLKIKKCLEYEKYQVDCTRQLSKIEYVIKAVSVRNNQMAFAKDYAGSAEHKFCGDKQEQKSMPPFELSLVAIDIALSKMRQDVAPYSVVLTIALIDSDESNLADHRDAKKLLDNGLVFAEEGRMDRACENFKNASEMYTQSPALLHNLGVCAETKNQLDDALRFYRKADGFLEGPNKIIDKALARINGRIVNAEKVANQLR